MSAVIERIESILTSGYSNDNFVEFAREVFAGMKLVAPDRFRKEFSNFSSHIEGCSHIGNYNFPDGKKLVIFSVQLINKSYVEGSRSTQRSYAKKLIENANADAAFIAFYTEGDPKWRVSFVRLDYEIKFENGKLKTAENMTPAKRYSYLVGNDEPCHTAIDRFRKFITDSADKQEHPTLDELEEAFSVEAVTNEFFALYCEKFHQLREHLEKSEDFRIEAEQHNFTSAQFAKKLMGQIVFLYFLQKKGWLGVGAWPNTLTEKEYKKAFFAKGAKSRELIPVVYQIGSDGLYHVSSRGLNSLSDEDETVLAQCVKGRPWGTGPRNFMRKLFEFSQKRNGNFFDDYLEPLFYNALNVNRGEQGYDPELHCRIPFLSGGLFEPIDGYEWKHNNFAIPNEVFSNRQGDNSRTGDGILDIFDRYNFTMSEDEPLEREVAIDPEMLGKVFENLLEVKDRKSKGAFYTPREIVHYMCQESLIRYLTAALKVSEEAVRDFILYGDFMKDEDTVKEKRLGNGGMYISEELYKIDSDGRITVDRLKEMDAALANVRIADPAVGSGAFPLGMLNEIVRARQNISAYFAIMMNSYDARMMYKLERSPHELKYETIRNCIFAADVEPSAVDITQLRLWLSLVIDDEINPEAQGALDGHRNPLPLPNLESNILCGDSLSDCFEGVRLINYSDIIGTDSENTQSNLFQAGFNSILPRLVEAQDKLFSCTDVSKKRELLQEISDLREIVIESQLRGQLSKEAYERYEESRRAASKPYVLWQLDFARVFAEKGGFDIVIGNPPYIQLQKSVGDQSDEKIGDKYEKMGFDSFIKTGDIYCLFYEKGINLLHQEGVLTFITSNKWMRASYGEKLRGLFAKKTNPICLIDFAGQKVFDSATVDVNILLLSKSKNLGKTRACVIRDKCIGNLSVYVMHEANLMELNTEKAWVINSSIETSIKEKIDCVGVPLGKWNISINFGIKTGCNEAFIISSEIKNQLVTADPKSAELIRPILRGRDIQRYSYEFADLWLISTFPSKHYTIEEYPAIRDYLLSFGISRLEQTGKRYIIDGEVIKARKKTNNKWFETQDSISYWNDFSRQKIIWKRIGSKLRFSYDESGIMCLDSTCFAVGKHIPYLVAVLNSSMGNYLLKDSPKTGTGDLIISVQALEPTRIPLLSEEDQKPYEELLSLILDYQRSGYDYTELEEQLDNLVFDAYGLSQNERNYVKRIVSERYR